MKTTLVIADPLMFQLKERALQQKKTISELVSSALHFFLKNGNRKKTKLPPIPTFHGGEPLVDINNREALWKVTGRPL